MRREWNPEDLIASWTLVEDDWRLVGNKTGATGLGFALLLKFFELARRAAAGRHAPSAQPKRVGSRSLAQERAGQGPGHGGDAVRVAT